MTEADLDRIERELEIRLPAVYRRIMLDFPVRACAGNEELALWDSAEGLIRFNHRLRDEFSWPAHLYALGQLDGDESNHAIDLRDPAVPVWWVDHWQIDAKGSGPVGAGFEKWVAGYSAELRSVLEEDRIDPDSAPDVRRRIQEERAWTGCRLLVLWAVASLIAVATFVAWLALRRAR